MSAALRWRGPSAARGPDEDPLPIGDPPDDDAEDGEDEDYDEDEDDDDSLDV